MKAFRRNLAVLSVAGLLIFGGAFAAIAAMETKTGTMTGLACATVGYTCPLDQADPMLALERDFVLLGKSGDFYLMPNLDRAVKARHALKEVTVKGFVDERYRSITVEELIVDGRTVWSNEMERQMRERLEELQRQRAEEWKKIQRAP